MHTYNTYETRSHNNITKHILLQNRNIELPTKKTQECKENNETGMKIPENMVYTLGRFDPNHISNTPPNHFIENLKKRIDVYYCSHSSGLTNSSGNMNIQ